MSLLKKLLGDVDKYLDARKQNDRSKFIARGNEKDKLYSAGLITKECTIWQSNFHAKESNMPGYEI